MKKRVLALVLVISTLFDVSNMHAWFARRGRNERVLKSDPKSQAIEAKLAKKRARLDKIEEARRAREAEAQRKKEAIQAKKAAERRAKELEEAREALEEAREEARVASDVAKKAVYRARKKRRADKIKWKQKQIIASRTYARKKLRKDRRNRDESMGKWDYLYKLPTHPFYAQMAKARDFLDFGFQYKNASSSYSSSDHSQDISKLIFGESDIRIQDILLVSKLLIDGKVDPASGIVPSNFYLHYLGDEVISFDGDMEVFRGTLSYNRRFKHGISVGVEIPVVHRINRLRLKTDVSATNLENIQGSNSDTNNFPTKYNQDFTLFVEDILATKGISMDPKNTSQGFGDMSAFVNWEIYSKYIERLFVGLRILFPTARDRDVHKLWDAELGNSGFTEVGAFASLTYSKKSFFNPHVFMQGTYSLPAYVDRRVPRRREYTSTNFAEGGTSKIGSTDIDGLDNIVFDDQVKFKSNTPFSADDTIIRRFSTQTTRTKVHRGPEFRCIIGNVFEEFLTRAGYLDLYYDFSSKARDHMGARFDNARFNPSILKDNSFHVEHKFGANFSYQYSQEFRFELGGLYTFAGRNAAEMWEANTAIKWEF